MAAAFRPALSSRLSRIDNVNRAGLWLTSAATPASVRSRVSMRRCRDAIHQEAERQRRATGISQGGTVFVWGGKSVVVFGDCRALVPERKENLLMDG